MAKRFDGKVAIVTGGSSGIGEATALKLAEEGAKIVLAARSADKLEKVAGDIKSKTGCDIITVPTDVAKPAEIKALVDKAIDTYGKIDVALVNAGMFDEAPIMELTEEAYDRMYDTNVKSVVFSLKYIMTAMKDGGIKGSIVITSTVLSLLAKGVFAGKSMYCSSKAAVDMIGNYGAIEAAEYGIRVNTVHPGVTATAIFGMPDEAINEMAKPMHLTGRAATSMEVANLNAFLLSDEASFVTGSQHRADGGFLLKA